MSQNLQRTQNLPRPCDLTVPLRLFGRNSSRSDIPLQWGLCVPRGHLMSAASGSLSVGNDRFPVQLDVTSRWSDGSIRWLTASSVLAKTAVTPPDHPGDPTPRHSRSYETALLQFDQVSAPSDQNLTQVRMEHDALVVMQQQFTRELPSESSVRLEPRLRDASGCRAGLQLESVRDELRGPIRRVFVVSGRIASAPFVTLQWRISVWPGTGLIEVETRIRNTRRAEHRGGLWDLGDPGSVLLSSLEVRVTPGSPDPAAECFWKAEVDTSFRRTSADSGMSIVQYGSGGRCWRGSNHVTADGDVTVAERGYEAYSASGVLRGHRAEPIAGLLSESDGIAVAVPEFWQQFPGSLTVAAGSITCGLFPDLEYVHELQGGEQKTRSIWIRTGLAEDSDAALDWVFRRPRLMPEPEWIRDAEVFPWFTIPEQPEGDAAGPAIPEADPRHRLQLYLNEATTGDCSFAARRERIDEYGWRNYGDVHADHEQTHYDGSNTVVSHYNNQFDLIYGGLLQWAATGDPRWCDLFEPLARHVADIDIYHTDEDRDVFNGGLFWHTDHYVDARTATHRTYSCHNGGADKPYGGGPCNEHNYTTGLLYCCFLTGHPELREAVLSLAEWVIRMDDGRSTVYGLFDDGPTGYATHTVFEDFHGPGRGAGNSVNALLDAWLLTRTDRYLLKAEELIRRCVHPDQNIDALNLLDAEGHWSYTVFLTALGRYLLEKSEAGDRDGMYTWARASLAHFGRWMAAHERPSLSRPEELQFPTEAWAAQDFRKANVLRIAAACDDDPDQAARMRAVADDINDAAWRDLFRFGRGHLTARCLSILLTEGQRDLFHRRQRDLRMAPGEAPLPEVAWQPFIPQRLRVRQMLRSPRGCAAAVVRALHPLRCWRTLDACRRHR